MLYAMIPGHRRFLLRLIVYKMHACGIRPERLEEVWPYMQPMSVTI